MFQGTFCTKCGQKQRGPNHLCQPSAIKKHLRLQSWMKRSAQALKPGAK